MTAKKATTKGKKTKPSGGKKPSSGKTRGAKASSKGRARSTRRPRPSSGQEDCPVGAAPGAPVAEILKLPVHIDGLVYRKRQQDWGFTVAIDKTQGEYVKPLMDYMGDPFIMILVRPKNKDEMVAALRADSLEDLTLIPEPKDFGHGQ